jgi:CubicO group peptidase (beta-lactamase class C family)
MKLTVGPTAVVRRAPWAISVGAMAAIGAAAFIWSVVTDSTPSARGERFDRIDAYVRDQMDDARIPGAAIAIVEQGEIVHAVGFGGDGHGDAVTADTPFWIGSNTKSITALAILQLVEAGRVDLDAPIVTYLPEFRLADSFATETMTVGQLLHQTSGLARSDGLRAVVDADPDDTIANVVSSLATVRTNRPIGETFEYSNLNSVVLGRLVEVVTGTSWQAYVQTSIFDPIGMTNTYTDRDTAADHGLTATHRTIFGLPIPLDAQHLSGLAPSGYVYSSATDMARYLTTYLNGGAVDGRRVLGPEGVASMLSPATSERSFHLQGDEFTARYGAGWFVGAFGAAQDARWHQGSLPHFNAWMVLLPDTQQGVVVLLNSGSQFELGGANAAWSRIPQGVVNLLRGEEPPTGTSATRFFVVFDTLLACAVLFEIRSIVRAIAGRRSLVAGVPRIVLSIFEVALAGAALVVFPTLAGGLGWRAAFLFVPDLSVAVLALAGLGGVAAAARLVRTLLDRRAGVGVKTRSRRPSTRTRGTGVRHAHTS